MFRLNITRECHFASASVVLVDFGLRCTPDIMTITLVCSYQIFFLIIIQYPPNKTPFDPHLDAFVHPAEHIVDLLLEATTQHLVGLVKHEALDVRRLCNQNDSREIVFCL